jgi:hypothetical protein
MSNTTATDWPEMVERRLVNIRVLPCISTSSPQTVELAVHNDGLSIILELSYRSVIFGRMD